MIQTARNDAARISIEHTIDNWSEMMNQLITIYKSCQINKMVALGICLTAFVASQLALNAQDDCCEAYIMRAENASDLGSATFRLYLDVAEGVPCNLLGYSMVVQGGDANITLAEDGDFSLEIDGNTLTWTTCCNSGDNN